MFFLVYFNIHHYQNMSSRLNFSEFCLLFYLFIFDSFIPCRVTGRGCCGTLEPSIKCTSAALWRCTRTSQHTFHLFVHNLHHPGLEQGQTELPPPCLWLVPTRTESARTILNLVLFLGRLNLPLCKGVPVGYCKTEVRQPEQGNFNFR